MDKKMAVPSCRMTFGELQSEQAVDGPAVQASFQQVGVWSCGRLAILNIAGTMRGSNRAVWPLPLSPLSSSLES
ncbi:unknown_gene_8009 [Phodopus roborovskii]|uniref:Unknown_gene_8009 protein n=1 Tax=Phodopus roborovskii TaxID=109678 RepID=A0AAU9ZXC1_PHORO|nr:unknown_gene_8009 [Phodopus roborovskii]